MQSQRSIDDLSALKQDTFLTQRYELQSILGEGCFGKIVQAINKKTQHTIALKLQKFKKSKIKMVLKNQIQILKKIQGKQGIPRVEGHGDWDYGTYVELQLLSHDLNRPEEYSTSTIIDLAYEAIKILEGIHAANIIHQDLKPHNLMRNNKGQLFIIDFGLARQLPLRRGKSVMRGFIGTPRYASVRAHNLLQQGKKDDLQSLFYNLAYLYYRRLPWSKLSVPNDQRLEKIRLLKVKHKQSLFIQMPGMFQRAFDYITSLDHLQEPNYPQLKGMFRRNKTLIMEPTIVISTQQQKRNTKRVSLNVSNFLQVPQPQFVDNSRRRKRQSSLEGKTPGTSPSQKSLRSSSQISAFSDVIQSQLMQLVEIQDDQNYKQDENIQPQLPCSLNLKSLVFKNPFETQC